MPSDSASVKPLRRVVTGSRLHFGPLNWPGPKHDRPDFGGLGLMVDAPATIATAWLPGGPAEGETAFLRDAMLVSSVPRVTIDAAAPRHVGLGSGTQRRLAVAAACGLIGSPERMAATTGRGVRSAIGVHGFCRGGLILDGGRPDGEPLGRLTGRADVPEHWAIWLVRLTDRTGIFGEAERTAFAALPAMPASTHRDLRRLADETLDAAAADDSFAFAALVTQYGVLVGDFFAAAQGGRFADPEWETLMRPLGDLGYGVAQSSWGPTVAVIGPPDRAEEVDAILAARSPHEVLRTRPMNGPATIVDHPDGSDA